MPPKRRKASNDQDDDPSPSSTPAIKRRKKASLNYDPVNDFSLCVCVCKDTVKGLLHMSPLQSGITAGFVQ